MDKKKYIESIKCVLKVCYRHDKRYIKIFLLTGRKKNYNEST